MEKTIRQARKQGYDIVMFYVGLNSLEESLLRIANRVRKGGHDIPEDYVKLRYQNCLESLKRVLPLCDEVIFYDNENGFIKVAEIKYNTLNYTNGYRPDWIQEVEQIVWGTLTTYPTITRFGAHGNSAAKSAKEQLFRNENHYML